MPEENPNARKGQIESLSEKLYSRTRYEAPEDLREEITPSAEEAPHKWESPDIDTLLMADRRTPEQYPLMKKIFYVSLLFFVCAVAAAALIYFKGDNFISTKNLDITVEAPVSVSAGSPVDIEVTITNKNNASLSKVSLAIIYPEGTRNSDDTSDPLLSTKEELVALGPGEKITKNERAVFLGSEGEVKKVRISVTYKVEGSNATFTKDKQFEVTIGSAPLNVSITRPESVASGEAFTTTVSIVANSEEVLKDLVLRAEYPYGWSLQSSEPSTQSKDKNEWLLGDLSPGDKKTVILRGRLLGEDGEERTFRFFVGSGEGSQTPLSQDSMVVAIDKPSIALDIKLNGSTASEYAAPAGKVVQGTVFVRNNLPENLLNPQIEVRLVGSALDRQSVEPYGEGFYNSSQNSIIWNATNGDIERMSPGDDETLSFNFASLQNLSPGASNQKIDVVVTFTGRPQNSGADVKVTQTKTVKIASEISLLSRSLYSRGPFTNSGPVPPRAETETTYTVALTLGNTQNDMNDSKVTAILGPNVKWTGEVSASETVSYDEATRVVTWNVGTLPSGAGFSSQAREVFFKVALTPSLGQVGGVPVLLSNIAFTGTDAFTGTGVRVTNASVTTRISSDPGYVNGDETVVK
jgi:hypothetical protein